MITGSEVIFGGDLKTAYRMSKTLVVGLDGARLDVVQKWADEGYLPTISKLLSDGIASELKSVYPIHSFAAWTAFETGQTPANHGIYDIQLRGNGSYNRVPPSTNKLKTKTIYERLSDAGYTVGSINFPIAFPPRKVNGMTVAGSLTPSTKHPFAYPSDVCEKLRSQGYKILPSTSPSDKEAYIREVYELHQQRVDIASWFMDNHEWDLLSVLFLGTEILHHHFGVFLDEDHVHYNPGYEEVIREFYQEVDQNLARLIEQAGEDTNVIVLSDHGFTPYYGKLYLNSWLREHGFLQLKSGVGETMSRLSTEMLEFGKQHFKKYLPYLPKHLQQFAIEKAGGGAGGFDLQLVDWSNTKAYVPLLDGGISINLQGREPHGTVPRSEFESVRNEIIEAVENDNRLDGIIGSLIKKEDLYDGDDLNKMSDLFIDFERKYKVKISPDEASVIKDAESINHLNENSCQHTLNGVLLADGPDITSDLIVSNPCLYDVSTTILNMCRVPLAPCDGKILWEGHAQSTTFSEMDQINQAVSTVSFNAEI
jgi:predicted AlkP superfamily phosphohydrolase/phosphomutase